MKREKFLWALTGGHHEGLVVSRVIQKIATAIEGDGTGKFLDKLPQKVTKFFKEGLEPHFRAEEELMETFGGHVGKKDADLQRLFSDHRHLKSLLREGSLESLAAFATELDEHIRFEESQLFPRLERTLTQAEKEAAALLLEETIPTGLALKRPETAKEA